MSKSIGYLVVLIVVAAASYFAGVSKKNLGGQDEEDRPVTTQTSETRLTGKFKFISPLLECDSYAPSDLQKDKQLQRSLDEFSHQVIHAGKVTSLSIYYRDLKNGPWIGVNEREVFSPASLLKVPVLIAALKHSESNPKFLDKKLLFSELSIGDTKPNINDETIILGKSYTVRELLERMIVYSDNYAKNLILNEILPEGSVGTLWSDLLIEEPTLNTPENFLTVKDYSAFFRILYNSTYLTRANSEFALEILSRSHFTGGIRAGVDTGILVASKFGERGMLDSDIKQLHDCGIVYRDKTPYLLCVMTQGHDWAEQEKVIREISSIIYRGI